MKAGSVSKELGADLDGSTPHLAFSFSFWLGSLIPVYRAGYMLHIWKNQKDKKGRMSKEKDGCNFVLFHSGRCSDVLYIHSYAVVGCLGILAESPRGVLTLPLWKFSVVHCVAIAILFMDDTVGPSTWEFTMWLPLSLDIHLKMSLIKSVGNPWPEDESAVVFL